MILSITDKIFTCLNECKEFLLGYEIVKMWRCCIKCGGITEFKIYKRDGNSNLGYRCKTLNCRNIEPIYRSNIPFTRLIHVFYLLALNASYKQLNFMYNLPNNTIHRIKKKVREDYKIYVNKRPIFWEWS
ncbi:hypothetical protein DMUE_0771 [Dictyocoela muelleri]|nr:hypothetical protein DMUE_0771 [Dictyocoela muelleri]